MRFSIRSISPTTLSRASSEFRDDDTHRVHYVRSPFQREPDFGVTSVNYDFQDLLSRRRTSVGQEVNDLCAIVPYPSSCSNVPSMKR